MSSKSIPVYTCDRCGHCDEIRSRDILYGWGVLVARQNNGPFSIGDEKYDDGKIRGADLCQTCVATLKSWWLIGKDAAP